MRESPHFLRLTRALALGALAAPALHCAPTVAQRPPLAAQGGLEPSASPSPRVDSEPIGTASARSAEPTTSTPPSTPPSAPTSAPPDPAENNSEIARDGAVCPLGGRQHYRVEARTLHTCYCQVQGDRPGQRPSRWACSAHQRATRGLDGTPCEELGSDRADADGGDPGNLCVCVANGARREYACYLAFNLMAGPLAPPELVDPPALNTDPGRADA